MEISPEEKYYFQGWENPFETLEGKQRKKELKKFEHLLKEIIAQNEKVKFYDEIALRLLLNEVHYFELEELWLLLAL